MKQFLGLFILLLTALALQGCDAAPAPVTLEAPGAAFLPAQAVNTPTLLPAFVATPQAAQAAAQSTIQAGEARLAELQPQLTAAVATDQAIATSQARAATANAESINATEAAIAARTATASREAADRAAAEATTVANTQTATAQFAIDAVHAQETQAALSILLASSTAEVQRIEEQQRSLLIRTWIWRIFWMALAVLAVIAVALLFRPLLRAVELWAITRRDRRGEEYLVERDRAGRIRQIHLPARAAGAALRVLPDGSTAVEGVSPHGPEWSDRVIAGEQFSKLMAGLVSGRKPLPLPEATLTAGRRMVTGMPAIPEFAAPQPASAASRVVILEPENPRVRPLLDEADRKLLEAGDEHEQLFD